MARDWFINEYDKYTNDSATLLRLSHNFFGGVIFFLAESFNIEAESVKLW
jgi:hypothetical protein